MPWGLLDAALASLVLGLAAAMLGTVDRTRMAMLFIAFGGVVALLWIRLRAPDLALAEAAVGAALTGALVLRAQAAVRPADECPRPIAVRFVVAGFSIAVFCVLAGVLVSLDWQVRPGLGDAVAGRLPESGVTNPVTAVLLNFRGYDTLLEVAVLLASAAAVWRLGVADAVPRLPRRDPLFLALLRPLLPLLCIVAGHLLWLGTFAPGGAFQAGAVLSAPLLLPMIAGLPRTPGRCDGSASRTLLAGGLLVFVGVAAATAASGASILQYPVEFARTVILLVEGALTVSVALTFVVLFLGGRPPPRGGTR